MVKKLPEDFIGNISIKNNKKKGKIKLLLKLRVSSFLLSIAE